MPHDSDSQSTVKDNIAAGCSYVVQPDRVVVPQGVVDPAVPPPPLLAPAHRAFGPGVVDPSARPSAREWLPALGQERPLVQLCGVRSRHSYGPRGGPAVAPAVREGVTGVEGGVPVSRAFATTPGPLSGGGEPSVRTDG
ncbi:hypothetical protein I5Q34_08345 [Streptomyces sp. AV19]|uniref:hypothetical protein n=1 Tax=Streptomyces sp. AV19 TaxID=2793068 RepID=UPI0018FE315D|nr:hypothetical protein [Streptomyces sp. AV19]MBH1934302.1 hypothetical protein [Streptomyces sp. AV19]MDG4533389.1 hypothetical protein [Streptomyces sp. AV19]